MNTIAPHTLPAPATLAACLGADAPIQLWARGNPDLLDTQPLALFCSRKCPGKLILQTYDLAQKLRDAGVTVLGGFHSPMEQECLRILLCSPHPVIICPARGLPQRLPPEWQRPLAENRLLILAPFSDSVRRATQETAQLRNRVAAALADRVFVAHAEPHSQTEAFCREVIGWGKPLLTFPENASLLALGAQAWTPGH